MCMCVHVYEHAHMSSDARGSQKRVLDPWSWNRDCCKLPRVGLKTRLKDSSLQEEQQALFAAEPAPDLFPP